MRRVARFAFLVHPLTPVLQRIIAARGQRWKLLANISKGQNREDTVELCRLALEYGDILVEGVVISIPMLPEQILSNQDLALEMMKSALSHTNGGIDVIGLGSLLAVAAGRGTDLAKSVWQPVTTGAAATAWVASENAIKASKALGTWPNDPISVLGYSGTVGHAVANYLIHKGANRINVAATGAQAKRAQKEGFSVFNTPEHAVLGCPVVVGASTTGFILDPKAMIGSRLLLDVAIPPTLRGKPPPWVKVLAGEAVNLPNGYKKGMWGSLYHILAGYGPTHLFACVIEPLLMAIEGLKVPLAQGRKISVSQVEEVGRLATNLGFTPALAQGFKTVKPNLLMEKK